MTTIFRASKGLLERVRDDLKRPHKFAAERVGFLLCRAGRLNGGGAVILAANFQPVEDNDYERDERFSATMGPAAIRKAMQLGYAGGAGDIGLFHVHMHEHSGIPELSRIDESESRKFVPDFFSVAPMMPHGAIVLSHDQAAGLCWRTRAAEPNRINRFASVGAPLSILGTRQ